MLSLTRVGSAQGHVWFPQEPGRQATLEKHMAEREAEKLLSSLGLHRAETGQCSASAWQQHGMWGSSLGTVGTTLE